MHFLLEKLFKKRGIKDINDLDQAEKETYDKWEKILGESEMTVDKIKEFCQSQLNVIEEQLKSFDNTLQKNERLVIYFNVYKAIMDLTKSPVAERESLIKYLNQLIQ